MKHLILAFVLGLAFASPTLAVEPPMEKTTVSGTVRVEKSITGAVEQVSVVAPSGEVTRVVGTARDAIAVHDGKTVEVEGTLAMRSDGQRTMVAEAYAVQ